MIKQCKVLLDNPAVTVVDFDGRKIQLPHTESNYIKYENGKYAASTKEEYEAEQKKAVKAAKKKKTTTNNVELEIPAEPSADGEEA